MIQLYALAAGALAIAAASFTAGWQVQGWRHDANELERQQQAAQDARAAVRRIDVAAEGYEARREAARSHDEAKQQEVIRVITKTEYRDRCLDDDGMRILADDLDASDARRGVAPAVPSASAPG